MISERDARQTGQVLHVVMRDFVGPPKARRRRVMDLIFQVLPEHGL